MKIFSAPYPPKPLERSRAWTCVMMNQLAFPGMGTLMAGRRQIGYAQAGLMLAGFFLAMGFALWFIFSSVRALTEPHWTEARWRALAWHYAWTGFAGLGLCVAAWCWALFSSLQILREATNPATAVPPKI